MPNKYSVPGITNHAVNNMSKKEKGESEVNAALDLTRTKYDRFMFKKSGGKVEQILYREPKRKKPISASKPCSLDADTTGYSNSPPQKWERLCTLLTTKSIDFKSIQATKTINPSSNNVWGALGMAKLDELSYNLLLWKYIGCRSARSVVYSQVFNILMERKETEKWDVRKGGTIDMLALHTVLELRYPKKYKHLKMEHWTKLLKLKFHMDWPRRWKRRHDVIRHDLEVLEMQATKILCRRFS